MVGVSPAIFSETMMTAQLTIRSRASSSHRYRESFITKDFFWSTLCYADGVRSTQ